MLNNQKHNAENSLYHYTTQVGFKGIVESKSLWATNILYLNDSAEFVHAVNLMRNGLRVVYDESKLSEKEEALLNEIDKRLNDFKLNRSIGVFVCSFSRNKDKLSQWRGYCSGGDGYSLRLDFNESLLSRIKENQLELVECIYADDYDSPKPVLEFIESALASFNNTQAYDRLDNQINIALESFRFQEKFLELATRLKHSAFEEEHEWRLVSAPMWLNEKQVKYRTGKSMLIPYIEIPLADEHGLLNIPEVWVGPTPHPTLAKSSAENFLIANMVYAYKNQVKSGPFDEDMDYGDQRENTKVSISNAPYRIW